jgi:hypothetical protein
VKVYDEIQVVSAAEQAKRREAAKAMSTQAAANQPDNDFWVETKISAKLVSAQDVISVNYRWRSVRNTLYVIGRAQSKQEMTQVLALIKAPMGWHVSNLLSKSNRADPGARCLGSRMLRSVSPALRAPPLPAQNTLPQTPRF